MALSDDQKAMLRLLAQREQGYEDMASLMGISVEEVRAKVSEALANLDSDAAPVAAKPAEPAVETPSPAQEATAPAKPEPMAAPTQPPSPAAKAAPKPSGPRLSNLPRPSNRRQLIEWAGGALVVILAVLFITGAIDIGGGDDSKSADTATTASGNESSTLPASASKKITQAVLSPVDDSDAKGIAVFGRLKRKIIMQVEAVDLPPSPSGSSYTIWLYKSPELALRVGATPVGESGGLAVRLQIPEEAFAAVAARVFDQISISLTSDAEYKAEVTKARQENRLPVYTGTEVLSGPVTGPKITTGE